MSERTIPEILADLSAAGLVLSERRQEEAQARSAATAALNTLNGLQKELDEALAALKKDAPRETDWHRAATPGFRLPA